MTAFEEFLVELNGAKRNAVLEAVLACDTFRLAGAVVADADADAIITAINLKIHSQEHKLKTQGAALHLLGSAREIKKEMVADLQALQGLLKKAAQSIENANTEITNKKAEIQNAESSDASQQLWNGLLAAEPVAGAFVTAQTQLRGVDHIDSVPHLQKSYDAMYARVAAELTPIITQQRAVEAAITDARTKLNAISTADAETLTQKIEEANAAITAITTEINKTAGAPPQPIIVDGGFKTAIERTVTELSTAVTNAAAQRRAQLIVKSLQEDGEIGTAYATMEREFKALKADSISKTLSDEIERVRKNVLGAKILIFNEHDPKTINTVATAQNHNKLLPDLTAATDAIQKYTQLREMQIAFDEANKKDDVAECLVALKAIKLDDLKLPAAGDAAAAAAPEFPPSIKPECELFEAKLKAQIALVEAFQKTQIIIPEKITALDELGVENTTLDGFKKSRATFVTGLDALFKKHQAAIANPDATIAQLEDIEMECKTFDGEITKEITKLDDAYKEASKALSPSVKTSLLKLCKTAQDEIKAVQTFIAENKQLIEELKADTETTVAVTECETSLHTSSQVLIQFSETLKSNQVLSTTTPATMYEEIKKIQKGTQEQSTVLHKLADADAEKSIHVIQEKLTALLRELQTKLNTPDLLADDDKEKLTAFCAELGEFLESVDATLVVPEGILSSRKAVEAKSEEFIERAQGFDASALKTKYRKKIEERIKEYTAELTACFNSLDPSRSGYQELCRDLTEKYTNTINALVEAVKPDDITPKALSTYLKQLQSLHDQLKKSHDEVRKISNTIAQPTQWFDNFSPQENIEKYLAVLSQKPEEYKKDVIVLLPLKKNELAKKVSDKRLAGYEVWGIPGTVEKEHRASLLSKYYGLVGMGKRICYPYGESSCNSDDFKRFVKFCDWVDKVGGPVEALKKFETHDQDCPTLLSAELATFKQQATLFQTQQNERQALIEGRIIPYEQQSLEKRKETLTKAAEEAKEGIAEAVRTAKQFDSAKVVSISTSVNGDVSKTRLIVELEKQSAQTEKADITILQTIKTIPGINGKLPVTFVEVTCECKGIQLDWKTECTLKAIQTLATRVASGAEPRVKVIIAPPEVNPDRGNDKYKRVLQSGHTIELSEKEAQLIDAYKKAGYEEIGLVVNGDLKIFEGVAAPTNNATKSTVREYDLDGGSKNRNRFPPTPNVVGNLNRRTDSETPAVNQHAQDPSTPRRSHS